MFEKYLAENKGIVITDNEDLAAALHEVYDNIEIVVAESEAEGIVLAARVMAEAEAMRAQPSDDEYEDEDEDDVCPCCGEYYCECDEYVDEDEDEDEGDEYDYCRSHSSHEECAECNEWKCPYYGR